MIRPASWFARVIFVMAASCSYLLAQDSNPSPQSPPGSSIQRQLDELKEGQERLSKQLEEIRALLQEKQDKVIMAPAPPPPAKLMTLNLHGEPFRGSNTAKIGIVEYSDFGCSFCAKYEREVFPLIDTNYLQTGKVKYFFRDLPALEHSNALAAAAAARCAGEQGKFWEMHDMLFAAQPALSVPELQSYAQALNVDMAKFNECFSSKKYEPVIRRVAAAADRMGLYGTPVFLIGQLSSEGDIVRATKVILGGSDYESLKTALDEQLAAVSNHP